MDQLRRIGGEAGVLAGIATAWLFLGLVFVYPSAGLDVVHQTNPHRYLPFVAKHEALVWAVNIIGGLLAALFTAILIMALTDRFRDDDPAITRIGQTVGLFGASAMALGALVRHTGLGELADLYATNKVGAAHAFYAMNGVLNGLYSFGAIGVGCAVLIVGKLMLKNRRYESVAYLSLVAGGIMVLSGIFGHVLLSSASYVAGTIWLAWSAITLRWEVGPAFFGRPAKRRNGRARQAA